MSIGNIKINISTYFSELSKMQFESNVWNIQKYLNDEVKYIIINLYLQLGKIDASKGEKVLEYKDKNNIKLSIQFKIKNYITFKSKENLDTYIAEEINDNDLYIVYPVENKRIITE